MLIFIIKECILMVAIFSITVTGKIKPATFVKNIFTLINPEQKPYVYIQMKLERIGDSVGLYDLPENERFVKTKELMENPRVQEIIKECDRYNIQPSCNMSQYRTYDGSCNNLKYPLWGSADYMMDRYLPATYEGASGFRKSVEGGHLPNPRSISLKLIDKDNPANHVSALFTFFGQIIAHDISSAPTVPKEGDESIKCCSPPEKKNPLCRNVHVPKGDPFYGKINVTCLPFERTAPYPKCNFEKRNVWNKETSLLDTSPIYGYNKHLADGLRTKDGSGKLKSQNTTHGELLPANHVQNFLFCPRLQTTACFTSGDERVNQHAMLTMMHTILTRFHNAIADKLPKVNPKWDDENIYQEARRIVNAVYQCIVYKEYLPWLVPTALIKEYELSVDEDSIYDDMVNPGGLAEFTTASFRLHSMIPSTISKNNPDVRFNETYSSPNILHEGKTESFVSGSCEVPSQKNDRYMTTDVDDNLFRTKGSDYGLDLTVFDVQRGRDHGLPRYVDVLKKCSKGKIEIQDFSDLSQLMSEDNILYLQSIYKNVSDVDLIIGIYLERKQPYIDAGFTVSCLSAEQFHRLKFGDSFFFTHTNGRYPFTKDQLKSIRSFTFAHLICQAGGFTSIRKYPMLVPGLYNYKVNCESLPSLDLTPWKDSSANEDSSAQKSDAPSPKTCYFYFFCS